MLTKVTKHSKNKFTSKETKLSTIRFCRALDNSKKNVTVVGCLPLSYTFLSYCNGLLEILQRVQICSIRCMFES